MPNGNQHPADRHHYVARSYLKRFADQNGRLIVYRRGRERGYTGGQWSAGFERSLYAPEETRSVRQDDVEHLFEQIVDTPAAKLISKLAEGQKLELTERAVFARCLHIQSIRSPAARDSFMQFAASVAEDGVRTWLSEMLDDPSLLTRFNNETGGTLDAPTIRELLESLVEQELVVEAGKDQWLSFLLEEFRDGTVPSIIATLEWTVVEAPEDGEFLTSDCPVVHAAVHQPPAGKLGGGWNSTWIETTFALDPQHLLLLRRSDTADPAAFRRAKGERTWIGDVNRRVSTRAQAEVYLRNDTGDVARWLADSPKPSHFVDALSTGRDRIPHIRNPTVAGLAFDR